MALYPSGVGLVDNDGELLLGAPLVSFITTEVAGTSYLIPAVGVFEAPSGNVQYLLPGAGVFEEGLVETDIISAGASEVLIEGCAVTLSITQASAPTTETRADTYGGGLYDRTLELQAEDELILEVIMAFLKKAA